MLHVYAARYRRAAFGSANTYSVAPDLRNLASASAGMSFFTCVFAPNWLEMIAMYCRPSGP